MLDQLGDALILGALELLLRRQVLVGCLDLLQGTPRVVLVLPVLLLFEGEEGVDVQVVLDSVVLLDQHPQKAFELQPASLNEGGIEVVVIPLLGQRREHVALVVFLFC